MEFETKRGFTEKNTFWRVCFPEKHESVISFKGKNHVFEGTPRLVMRLGESEFGEQIFFDSYETKYKGIRPGNTVYNTSEFYLPKDHGIKFLEFSVEFFKKIIDGEIK